MSVGQRGKRKRMATSAELLTGSTCVLTHSVVLFPASCVSVGFMASLTQYAKGRGMGNAVDGRVRRITLCSAIFGFSLEQGAQSKRLRGVGCFSMKIY